jgi:hypothetical protein
MVRGDIFLNSLKLEKCIITAVAIHSFILGIAMLVDPLRILSLVEWDYEGDLFFPTQSGVFLLLFAAAYLAAIQDRTFAWFLVLTKIIAFFFLVSIFRMGHAPPVCLLAASVDGLMGLSVSVLLIYNIRKKHHKSILGRSS